MDRRKNIIYCSVVQGMLDNESDCASIVCKKNFFYFLAQRSLQAEKHINRSLFLSLQDDFWHWAQVQFQRENISFINLTTNMSFLLLQSKEVFGFVLISPPSVHNFTIESAGVVAYDSTLSSWHSKNTLKSLWRRVYSSLECLRCSNN